LFSVELELFLLVVQAALYVVLSAKILDRLERAAREAGTLGLRGQ
jgi:hypothetical protein